LTAAIKILHNIMSKNTISVSVRQQTNQSFFTLNKQSNSKFKLRFQIHVSFSFFSFSRVCEHGLAERGALVVEVVAQHAAAHRPKANVPETTKEEKKQKTKQTNKQVFSHPHHHAHHQRHPRHYRLGLILLNKTHKQMKQGNKINPKPNLSEEKEAEHDELIEGESHDHLREHDAHDLGVCVGTSVDINKIVAVNKMLGKKSKQSKRQQNRNNRRKQQRHRKQHHLIRISLQNN
jgi:hypothetical protein